MRRSWVKQDFDSVFVEDRTGGCAGFELYRTENGLRQCVAKIIYWDAIGQYMTEAFVGEIPLQIIEELIAETKRRIGVPSGYPPPSRTDLN